jgi:hypothetical protein
MNMLRKLQRIGNSRGVILDRTMLDALGAKTDVILTIQGSRIVIEAAPPADQPLPRRAFRGDLRGVPDDALPSLNEMRESRRLARKVRASRPGRTKNFVPR